VASHGHYDEDALGSILKAGAAYVGLVASRARGAAVRTDLEQRGVQGGAAVRIPAGLELGARTPPEVAVSILAEIVQARPTGAVAESTTDAPPPAATPAPAFAVDPVCGMQVEIARARHSAEVEGRTYHFCCPHCRQRFLQDPDAYRSPTA
jgi:xanthine dehydrogenase accessory factor